jgi:hypothetical protein
MPRRRYSSWTSSTSTRACGSRVRSAGLILFCVIVAALLAGWTLRRLGFAWGVWLSLVAGVLARVVTTVVFSVLAVRAAERGGIWFAALALASGVLALATLAFAGLLTWGVLKYGIDPED